MDEKQKQALYEPVDYESIESTYDEKKIKARELDPKCLDNRQPSFGMTNRGELIPCCWVDTQVNRFDKDYQKLLSVSKIEDYNDINEILLTDEWLDFVENISKGVGFLGCYFACQKSKKPKHKVENWYEDDGYDFEQSDESEGMSKKIRVVER